MVLRTYRHIKKRLFIKQFSSFGKSSAVGSNGTGKGCKLLGMERMIIGEDCFFGEGTELATLHNHFMQELDPHLTIGNHVRCVGGCRITCAGNINIGNDVLIGPDVFITDHNHGMDPTLGRGYSPQPLIIKDVTVEVGVWLGQRVCILPGVTIGSHSIIGANSVVTHDIPPYSIAVGSAARVVKQWDKERKEWVPLDGEGKKANL